MSHENRSRLSVDPGGKWRLYSPVIPASARALGTVRRSIGDVGALIQFEATGIYAQANAGVVRTLDQSKITAALAEARGTHGGAGRGQGRPAADGATNLSRKNVSLDGATIERLRALGDGDLSLGIRRAAAALG